MSHDLKHLVIYDSLLEDTLITDYYNLLKTEDEKLKKDIYYGLVRRLLRLNQSIHDYILIKMAETENPILERLSHEGTRAVDVDYACLKNDLIILSWFMNQGVDEIVNSIDNQHELMRHFSTVASTDSCVKAYSDFFEAINDKPIFHEQCDDFIELLRIYGTGRYANSIAFYLNSKDVLVPIEKYEPLDWEHIYDYDLHKDKLWRNTAALVEGRPFHHALLVGASGTGKSSCVKAVAKRFSDKKIRLIQLYKGQLRKLPELLESLSKSVFKFILFIDDLSFEVNEDEYKFLKSFIEGGIANEADNVAFYVTSNRRHLIKEIRSEREGDIHLQDFIQEMTSLSDRFSLNLTFEKLTQKAYFAMVVQMFDDEGIAYTREELEIEAKRWSLRHGGMSGRVANQYVKHIQMMNGK